MKKTVWPDANETDDVVEAASAAMMGAVKLGCPYCGTTADVPVQSLQRNALMQRVCVKCGSTYYLGKPSVHVVFPAEFVDVSSKGGVKIVMRDKKRCAAFLTKRASEEG